MFIITFSFLFFSNISATDNKTQIGAGVIYYFQPLTVFTGKLIGKNEDVNYGLQFGLGSGSKEINLIDKSFDQKDFYYTLSINLLIEFNQSTLVNVGPQFLLVNSHSENNIKTSDQTGLFVCGGIEYKPFSDGSFSLGFHFSSAFEEEGMYGFGVSFFL